MLSLNPWMVSMEWVKVQCVKLVPNTENTAFLSWVTEGGNRLIHIWNKISYVPSEVTIQ